MPLLKCDIHTLLLNPNSQTVSHFIFLPFPLFSVGNISVSVFLVDGWKVGSTQYIVLHSHPYSVGSPCEKLPFCKAKFEKLLGNIVMIF